MATWRGRWRGGQWEGGDRRGAKGRGRRRGKRRGHFTDGYNGMPGWICAMGLSCKQIGLGRQRLWRSLIATSTCNAKVEWGYSFVWLCLPVQRRVPQLVTLILPTVKMLSLGCERLPTPLKKKKKKVLDHYLHHDLGMLPLLRCFFAHLLILQYPDHHQNLISSPLYYAGPVHKISSQSVQNFLSNVVHRQTDKQTDKLTNATKNITSFAKEVKMKKWRY